MWFYFLNSKWFETLRLYEFYALRILKRMQPFSDPYMNNSNFLNMHPRYSPQTCNGMKANYFSFEMKSLAKKKQEPIHKGNKTYTFETNSSQTKLSEIKFWT